MYICVYVYVCDYMDVFHVYMSVYICMRLFVIWDCKWLRHYVSFPWQGLLRRICIIGATNPIRKVYVTLFDCFIELYLE